MTKTFKTYTFAELREQNQKYHLKKPYTYRSGDGFTAHVLEKYGPQKR